MGIKEQLKKITDPKLRELFRKKKRLLIRFVKANIKLYNNLCRQCQLKAFKNPNMPMSEYCEDCQQAARDCLGAVKTEINEGIKDI